MAPDTLIAYGVTVASGVAVLLQFLKPWLIDPRLPDGPQRDATIRLLSFALNLTGLLVVLAAKGALDWAQLVEYVTLAAGQTYAAHRGYQVLKTGSADATTAGPAGHNEDLLAVDPGSSALALAFGGTPAEGDTL
jgi:hypothetical protein